MEGLQQMPRALSRVWSAARSLGRFNLKRHGMGEVRQRMRTASVTRSQLHATASRVSRIVAPDAISSEAQRALTIQGKARAVIGSTGCG
ncbi:hypothetical protein [Rubidibacter lacunae]|uniref:hypothetical protein n=1 Tax=Rubidibacter lacunae TaxID=582514 RepID=UPI000425087A|nr:hypothetical protein [Rubidibacter lacunae]